MRRIYGIYDSTAKELVGLRMYILMCFRTDEEAARYFYDAISDKTSILNKHPADYTLKCLGVLTDTGFIQKTDEQVTIIRGDHFNAPDTDIPNNAHTPINA